MHQDSLQQWQHDHDFVVENQHGERSTRWVIALTAITMLVEIIAGHIFGSMALLADGWHMSTHVAAFAITLFAYRYARIHAQNPDYTFGTGKVSVLGGFASAVALAVVALMMAMESLQRFFQPQEIHYTQAILVAVIGLLVNIASAFLLHDHHHHDHDHDHDHDHGHGHGHDHHQDHNLRAAYFHVLADALTSLFAIIALSCGMLLGWNWMDPLMGIVGALVISRWAYGLLKDTSGILLDGDAPEATRKTIQELIEAESDNRVSDLHVWRVGSQHLAAIISVVTHQPQSPDHYKGLLKSVKQLSHVTIEVNRCKT